MLLGGWTPRAHAQPAGGVDLAFTDDWVWRGLTRASSATLQPAAWARAGWKRHSLAAGAWSALELGTVGQNELTTRGDDGRRVAEIDAWTQLTARAGTTDFGVGAVRYFYRGDAATGGRPSGDNTTEVYLQIEPLPGQWIVDPKLSVFWDVEGAHGQYVEASAGRSFTIIPEDHLLSLRLAATAGFAFNQHGPNANFARDGITHVDLAAGVTPWHQPWGAGFVFIHHQHGFDPRVKQVTPTRSSDHRTWVEAGVSLMAGHERRVR